MMDNINEIIELIKESLSDDLLKDEFKVNTKKHSMLGHCYVATEALYHLMDNDIKEKYVPSTIKVNDVTHWFLKNKENKNIIDITKDQFAFQLNYENSRNRFFLTKTPSKRSLILINRIYEKISN